MLRVIIALLIVSQWFSVQSLNILGVFPYEGRSHFFVFEKYLEKLAEKGHNLTVISHFPRKEVIPNYHDISLAGKVEIVESAFEIDRSVRKVLKIMHYIVTVGNNDCKLMLENESVQELWKSRRKFDLVVLENFNSDCGLGLAYKLGAPAVGLTSADLMPWHCKTFGIPCNPPLISSIFTSVFKPSLYERVETAALDCWFCYKYWNAQKVDQRTLEHYFGEIPPLKQLSREMRFMLLYRNFILSGSRLLPAKFIEVGGYHVAPPKPLPNDLLKFINDSKHGVIYISFGSILKETTLPQRVMDAILHTLDTLPQRVIWKWGGERFVGDPKKHYVAKWLPQNDLLAHPKVVAFFSHCGLLSTTEAVYHGVPLVVMPVLEDQILNAMGVVGSGFGVEVNFNDISKEILISKFRTALDPSFRSRVQTLSKAYSDRPVSAIETAIFWTEHAARYNLSAHNHAAEVPQYQYMCLELVVLFVATVVIGIFVMFKLALILLSVIRNLGSVKVKVKNS